MEDSELISENKMCSARIRIKYSSRPNYLLPCHVRLSQTSVSCTTLVSATVSLAPLLFEVLESLEQDRATAQGR